VSAKDRTVKITKRTVDAIKPNGTDFYVFDSELIGFGVRVRKTGGMTYIARYRAGSGRGAPVRRVTIATVGKATPDQAREVAKGILANVVKGADPAREKAEHRSALTFAELVDLYLTEVEATKKPKTYELYRLALKTHAVPVLGRKKAAEVSGPDIAGLRLSMRDTPTMANRVRNTISSMYGWAIDGKVLAKLANPATGVERFKENKRERFLTSDELYRLGAAIDEAETIGIPWVPDPSKKTQHAPKAENRLIKIDAHAAAALRLYLLTGARLREILHLTWPMVDLERGVLLLPDSKTGSKTIVLNAPARLVLSALPRVGRYVIPGDEARQQRRAKGEEKVEPKPRSDLKRPWLLVRKRAGLDGTDDGTPVRVHDLRHTHASIGVGASFGLPIVGKLLGHTQARTTERYAHLETDPVRAASEVIGARITDAMSGKRPDTDGNVIPIKKGKG
jgi:integrase